MTTETRTYEVELFVDTHRGRVAATPLRLSIWVDATGAESAPFATRLYLAETGYGYPFKTGEVQLIEGGRADAVHVRHMTDGWDGDLSEAPDEWLVSAGGVWRTGLTGHEMSDLIEDKASLIPGVFLDPESDGFYAYVQTRAAADQLADLLRQAITEEMS